MNKSILYIIGLLISCSLTAQQSFINGNKAGKLLNEEQMQHAAQTLNNLRATQSIAEEKIAIDYAAYDSIGSTITSGFIYNLHEEFEPEDYIVFNTANGIDSTNVKFRHASVAYKWLNDSFNEDSVTVPHETVTTTIDTVYYLYYHQNTSGLTNYIRTRVLSLKTNGFPNYNNVLWENIVETDSTLSETEFLDVAVLPVGHTLLAGQRFAVSIDFYGGDKNLDQFYLFNTFNNLCDVEPGITQANYSKFYPNSYYHISTTGGSNSVFDAIFPSETNDFLGFDHDGDGIRGEDEVCEAFFIENWQIGAFVTLEADLNATAIATNDTICPMGITQLTAQGFFGDEPYQYEWSPSDYLTQTAGGSTSAAPAETITYTLTATDNSGASSSTDITIYVDPIEVDLGPDQGVNCGATTQIIPSIFNPFGGFLDFNWSNGLDDDIVQLEAGNYSLTIENENCSATDDIEILLQNSDLTAAFSYTYASSSTVQFNNQSQNADTYVWNFGDGSPEVTSPNPVHTYNINGDFTVSLTSQADNCMVSEFQNVNINIVTSINNIELNAVKITPNPATDYIDIEIDEIDKEELIIRILDLSGAVIFEFQEQQGAVNKRIDVSNLSAGIYFVHVASEKGKKVEKLIINN